MLDICYMAHIFILPLLLVAVLQTTHDIYLCEINLKRDSGHTDAAHYGLA
jgi:hypothetical protein